MFQVHDLRPQSCNECDKNFVGAQQLRNHMKSHMKIVCELCLKEVPKNSRTSHKLRCKGLKFNCEKCDFATVRPDVLKLHEKTHINKITDNIDEQIFIRD